MNDALKTFLVATLLCITVTNRRVNALENVTIPKIDGVLSYIARELDELEREDFTRLKLVKGKKEIELAREAKQHADEKAAILAAGGTLKTEKTNDTDITADFDAADDADVVF